MQRAKQLITTAVFNGMSVMPFHNGLWVMYGEGNGNTLQYSCLENSMDRRAWKAYSSWGHKESDMTE